MINLPLTEQLLNAINNQSLGQNIADLQKSGWKNFSFAPEEYPCQDLRVVMRKDFHHHSASVYKWFRNLIIPKITIQLKNSINSFDSAENTASKSTKGYSVVFSCFKFHENLSYNVQQVSLKGQVIQPMTLSSPSKSKKKFNQLKLMQSHSKNLQFTQSHIQNRKIYYAICVTVCEMERNKISKEIMTSVLMPILVENRKKSLQNRTNKYMKFLEFLPIEFQRPLVLPLQESKDDNIFKYCVDYHMKSQTQLRSTSDELSKISSEQASSDIQNNFDEIFLNENKIARENTESNQSSSLDMLQVEDKSQKRSSFLEMKSPAVDDDILLSDDIVSALIYLSSKTIRHKIFHPFFLSHRFSQAFELKYRKQFAQQGQLSEKEILLKIQEMFLQNMLRASGNDYERPCDVLSFKNQPVCLIIRQPQKNTNIDPIFFHKISSQIVNYLECIQTANSLFVGFDEQIQSSEYEAIKFDESHYISAYDKMSRITIEQSQKSHLYLQKQKEACQYFEVKINQSSNSQNDSCQETQDLNLYRTVVNCEVQDENVKKFMKSIRVRTSSEFDVQNFSKIDYNSSSNSSTSPSPHKNFFVSSSKSAEAQTEPQEKKINFNCYQQKINQNQIQQNQLQLSNEKSTSTLNQKSTSTLKEISTQSNHSILPGKFVSNPSIVSSDDNRLPASPSSDVHSPQVERKEEGVSKTQSENLESLALKNSDLQAQSQQNNKMDLISLPQSASAQQNGADQNSNAIQQSSIVSQSQNTSNAQQFYYPVQQMPFQYCSPYMYQYPQQQMTYGYSAPLQYMQMNQQQMPWSYCMPTAANMNQNFSAQ